MSKPGLITAFKLRTHTTALAMALGVAGLTGLSVWAAVGQDLLQRPAMMAPKAARALTLNVATQGDRTLWWASAALC